MADTLKWLFLGDLQIPYHDKRALDLVMTAAKAWRPNAIDIVGDIDDQLEYSTFSDGLTDEFFKVLDLDLSGSAVLDAIALVLDRLQGRKHQFHVERITGLGQRTDAPLRAFLRKTKELWIEVRGETGFAEHEPVGIYLGNNLVLVVPPISKAIRDNQVSAGGGNVSPETDLEHGYWGDS